MATQERYPGALSNGSPAWWLYENGDGYTVNVANGGTLSGTEWGFSIPSNATITAIYAVPTGWWVEPDNGSYHDTVWTGSPTMPTPAQANASTFSIGFTEHSEIPSDVYTCDSFYAVIEYTEAPPAAPSVSTGSITSYSHNSITCTGSVTSENGSAVTARGIVWGTSANPTLNDSPLNHTHNGTGSGSFTGVASPLNPSTLYYVRAYATNGIGTTYGSTTLTQTTSAEPTYNTHAALGRVTIWNYALTADQVLAAYQASQTIFERDPNKGTVVLKDQVKSRNGNLIPAIHVRAGWWIQNIEKDPKPLYITGHSVDLEGNKNALTIGKDWMEEQIGVRMAELLAIPPTPPPETEPEEDDPMTDPGVIDEPPITVVPPPPTIPPPVTPPVVPPTTPTGSHLTPELVAARKAAYRRWLNQLPASSPFTAEERTYRAWWERYKAKHPNSDLI